MKSALVTALGALVLGAGWATAQAPINYPVHQPVNNSPGLAANAPGGAESPLYQGASNGYSGESNHSVYFSADYLLWKIRNGAIPRTATAVPVGLISVDTTDLFVTAPNGPFIPGAGQTVGFAPVSIVSNTQLGARSTNMGDQNGFRLTGGLWADPDMTFGLEASFFLLERGTDSFAAVSAVSSNQFIINTGFNQNVFLLPARTLVGTFPIFVVRESSSSTVGTASNALLGTEINGRGLALRFGTIDFSCLAGVRYIHYKDEIAIANSVRLRRPDGFPQTLGDSTTSLSSDLSFTTNDRIRIYNNFVGAQVGGDIDARFGSFFLNTRLKGAVGPIFQHAAIASNTQLINAGGGPTPPGRIANGGLLVGPGDVGTHNTTRFGFVTEFNLKAGYQVTDYLRAYVGYDGLYMGHMARAGSSSVINSLNTTVAVAGSSNTISANAPGFRFQQQDVWVAGLNFGFELAY